MTKNTPETVWGYALATVTAAGEVLDAWIPHPQLGEAPANFSAEHAPVGLQSAVGADPRRGVTIELRAVTSNLAAKVADTADAYLRLQLLSHCLVKPGSINLDGVFAALPNVVWTAAGPVATEFYNDNLASLRASGLTALAVDKFPRLTDYVAPRGVRIADASRVRLGAHLAPGTTVMHEGFVNFNAGTLGASMVEGRISQGVIVGDGSDIGGGASIMGTLSGGGTHRVTIGERALLGANSGIGISIGNDSVVEAGLYVTAGTKVLLPDGSTVKAAALSGADSLLFRRNSATGAVEVLPRSGAKIALNEDLHL